MVIVNLMVHMILLMIYIYMVKKRRNIFKRTESDDDDCGEKVEEEVVNVVSSIRDGSCSCEGNTLRRLLI